MKRFKGEGGHIISSHHVHHQSHHYPESEEERSSSGIQDVIQMCSFDATKSTKGASKLRRDLINAEIANLRDLLPLPSSTRQRLSQLQLMALVCVYVRKANYFQHVFKRHHELGHPFSTPNIGFSKSLSGFLIMMTQNGKLLYISDNAAEYLGHSMEDLLIHGDSVYDIIDKADHATVQTELLRNTAGTQGPGEETRLFLCRMNVTRNARRQMRFGDQKVVLLQGRYLSYLPLCSRNEPVFVGTCTPVAMPETRECVVQGATNVFTSIHSMDMKFIHIDKNGEHYLGYGRSELQGISWYQFLHWNYMREAQSKHRLISQSEQEKSCILLQRMETRSKDWIWVHVVLQVKDGTESNSSSQPHPTQSIIVATNQVLSEREAAVMRANSWLYHYYTVQTKLQYGLAYPSPHDPNGNHVPPTNSTARLAAAYFPQAYHDPTAAYHHQMVHQGGAGGTGSPHNGNGYPSHPHYHPHHIPHHHYGFDAVKGKAESPLDFSLSSAASAFEAYHHHHPYHGWTQNHSSNNHSHYNGGGSGGGGGTTNGVTYFAKSDHLSPTNNSSSAWSLSISSNKQIQISSNISPPSSSSSSSSTNGSSSTPRKKKKHNSSSNHSNSNGNSNTSPVPAERGTFSDGPVSVASIPSSYHLTRNRSSWKIENVTREQESSLTPSPVWSDGQQSTQRVPDLQGSTSTHVGSYGGVLDGLYTNGATNPGELIHCVPTYLPYPAGGIATSPTTPYPPPYTHPYGFPHPHHLYSIPPLSETGGSPNKENRLPPTPESDSNEHEESTNKINVVKWESL